MKPLSVPDGVPVLSRGRHRSPRRGACFMEFASYLAGERWSDHPACTHPLLAQLAREVNDVISDAGRQRMVPLVPSVVGRLGDHRTWLTLPVAVAAAPILGVPEASQRVLAAGLLGASLVGEGAPDLVSPRRQAREALDLVPAALAWAERLPLPQRISPEIFESRAAPAIIHSAVDGIVASGTDVDDRLYALLETGIAACPVPTPEREAAEVTVRA